MTRTEARYYNEHGARLAGERDFDGARDAFERALESDPGFEAARLNLGLLLCLLKRPEDAAPHFDAVLADGRAPAETLAKIGGALRRCGQVRQAAALLRRALAKDARCWEAHLNVGWLLWDERKLEPAERRYRMILDAEPAHADAQFALAHLELLKGDFAAGWRRYEARQSLGGIAWRKPAGASWDGRPLPGKTLLLVCEQGFGDSIQFSRFAPGIAPLAGAVVLRCQPGLGPLFRRSFAPIAVIEEGEAEPPHDAWSLLLSLPAIVGTTLETIPAQTPYLKADPAAVARWRQRLAAATGLRVGVAWRGNPLNPRDHLRSLPAARLAAALDLPGVSLVSLQKDAAAAEAADLGVGLFADAARDLTDFDETAALIASLDLVVTVDTAVAHLAGALGKPVWTLLPQASDWRWLLDREDSPWHPTMRLFRQRRPDDWDFVLRRVRRALEAARTTSAPASR
jgi:hypothetical protein